MSMRGLSRDNVLPEPAEDSIEVRPASTARRSLRMPKDDVLYDAKYHPMDDVTRPNMAATQRRRFKSATIILDESDEAQTSDSSEPSEPSDNGSDEEEASDENEDEDEDNNTVASAVFTTPTPDPRAVRFSSRAEARKPVNYNKKYHPQDHSLPGFRHRAQAHPQAQAQARPIAHRQKKRKTALPTPDDEEGDRPRKRLRSIGVNVRRPNVGRPAKCRSQAKVARFDQEVDDLVEMAMIGSQAPTQHARAQARVEVPGSSQTDGEDEEVDDKGEGVNDKDEENDDRDEESDKHEGPTILSSDHDESSSTLGPQDAVGTSNDHQPSEFAEMLEDSIQASERNENSDMPPPSTAESEKYFTQLDDLLNSEQCSTNLIASERYEQV